MGSKPSRPKQQQQALPRLRQGSADVPDHTVSVSSSPMPHVHVLGTFATDSGLANPPSGTNSRVGAEGRTVHFSLPQDDLIEEDGEDQESDITPAPDDPLRGDTASSLQSSLVGDCLSEEQLRKVRLSLGQLETVLGVSFDVDRVASSAQIVNLRANENVYVCGAESTAMYVVDSGALEVCTSRGETVVARLLAGDFCGEVSVLFNVKCTAHVQTECTSTLLLLPKNILLASMEGDLDHDKLLDWFVNNSYLDVCELFDAGHLMQKVVMQALKNLEWWKSMELSLLSKLAQITQLIVVSPGEVLCEIGDTDCPVYVIVRGSIEVTHADDLVGRKCVRKSTDSYSTPIQDFLNMQPSTQTVKAVGPCLAAILDRTTLHHAFHS